MIEGDRKRKWERKGKAVKVGVKGERKKMKEKVYLMLLQSKKIISNLLNHLFSYMGLLEYTMSSSNTTVFWLSIACCIRLLQKQKIKFKFNFLSI